METLFSELAIYMAQGGFVMPPLMVATVVLWYAIGHRHANLKRGRVQSVRRLVRQVQEKRLEAGNLPSTMSGRGVIDTAILIAFEEKQIPHDELRPYLDQRFYLFEERIRRFDKLITAIVSVAPLMGLLGTVAGMIETFESLGDMSQFSQSGGIAGGISQALFTTQMGLAVAIPGLLAKGWLDRRETELELELAQIKDIVCSPDLDKL